MNSTKTPPSDHSWAVRLNRWALIGSRHYMKMVVVALALYVGLPFLAPVFMRIGLSGPGEALYQVYSPVCHQFAFRSWFLFGEQNAYPRVSASLPGLRPYEEFLPSVNRALGDQRSLSPIGLELDAKAFIGDPEMGYKIALCQRCIGIYGALLIAGLLFMHPLVRRQLRPCPLWLYALLGLGPIGMDGVSQLLSSMAMAPWPVRESTPAFRLLTGALFGAMNAWLALPYLEANARESIREIEAKFARRKARRVSA